MLTVFDARQARHQPLLELQDGAFTQFAESPTRANAILSRLPDPIAPDDFGIDPILAVHAADYVDFLKSIYADWRGEGRAGDAIPYVFPVGAQSKRDHLRIDARIGSFAYDVGTPIAEHTFESAYWSAQTALTALDTISSGAAARSFALCRPPGHHAGRAYCGGYCYFNSAAIAADKALESGARRVAVLDVDYHHGNGTQDIFYARDDVFVVSIHADPRVDYPFFWGRADERGEDAGIGATLNRPLPRGTTIAPYLLALDEACGAIDTFGADLLIVSFGADTFSGDPISHFMLETRDYPRLGERIGQLRLPTLVCMEGGYAVDALGEIVSNFLEPLS